MGKSKAPKNLTIDQEIKYQTSWPILNTEREQTSDSPVGLNAPTNDNNSAKTTIERKKTTNERARTRRRQPLPAAGKAVWGCEGLLPRLPCPTPQSDVIRCGAEKVANAALIVRQLVDFGSRHSIYRESFAAHTLGLVCVYSGRGCLPFFSLFLLCLWMSGLASLSTLPRLCFIPPNGTIQTAKNGSTRNVCAALQMRVFARCFCVAWLSYRVPTKGERERLTRGCVQKHHVTPHEYTHKV